MCTQSTNTQYKTLRTYMVKLHTVKHTNTQYATNTHTVLTQSKVKHSTKQYTHTQYCKTHKCAADKV